MDTRDTFDNQGDQFVISHELLHLLRWIVENHGPQLQALITSAHMHQRNDAAQNNNGAFDYEEAQVHVIDFLTLMEEMLHEIRHEDETQVRLARQLLPALDQIDQTACDNEIVRSSAESATQRARRHPDQDAQQVLFKEILRRWKPGKRILN